MLFSTDKNMATGTRFACHRELNKTKQIKHSSYNITCERRSGEKKEEWGRRRYQQQGKSELDIISPQKK